MSQQIPNKQTDPCSIAVIGSGMAGLVTAKVLLTDGYSNVTIYSKDVSVGGTWCSERIFDGLQANSPVGGYHLSGLPISRAPEDLVKGYNSTGAALSRYFQQYAEKFDLLHRIHFRTNVQSIRRPEGSQSGWIVTLSRDGTVEEKSFDRLVICTGFFNEPHYPNIPGLDTFKGPIVHSCDGGSRYTQVLETVPEASPQEEQPPVVLIIGASKSANDACCYFAERARPVAQVYRRPRIFADPEKPPKLAFVYGRLTTLFSPHMILQSRIERFLHTNALGARIVRFFWGFVEKHMTAFKPEFKGQPYSLDAREDPAFWNVPSIGGPNGWTYLPAVKEGRIKIFRTSIQRIETSADGTSYAHLADGQSLRLGAVVCATGYKNSYQMFSPELVKTLGLSEKLSPQTLERYRKSYLTLQNPVLNPKLQQNPPAERPVPFLYRTHVPIGALSTRDIAFNGASPSARDNILVEVGAHWISSFFSGELVHPIDPKEAREWCEEWSSFMVQRYPNISPDGRVGGVGMNWAQHCDMLCQDMGVMTKRHGGFDMVTPYIPEDFSTLSAERQMRVRK